MNGAKVLLELLGKERAITVIIEGDVAIQAAHHQLVVWVVDTQQERAEVAVDADARLELTREGELVVFG